MKKVIRLGRTSAGLVFCWIELKVAKQGYQRLSISGVVGPTRDGNARGPCGQCQNSLLEITEYDNDWSKEKVEELFSIWERWHLNDMRAGSPKQEEFLRMNPVQYKYPQSYFVEACRALSMAGLHPDPETGYRYGSAWIYEKIPESVLDTLRSYPENNVGLPEAWQ